MTQWRQLCARAKAENPFLSPDYVLTAAKYCCTRNPMGVSIHHQGQLIGFGIFEQRSASRRMPVPHLRCWRSPHGYLHGMLIDPDHSQRALSAFWEYMQHSQEGWNAVEFTQLALDQPATVSLQQSATRAGVEYWMSQPFERAALQVEDSLPGRIIAKISTRRARSLRRGWKYLQKQGEVQFSIVDSPEGIPQCTEELLRLESLGWKAKRGTALAVQPEQAKFFREMIAQFAAQKQVFFSQLAVDGKTIAIVAHLKMGQSAYAFKLGWDPEYERGCPGFQLKSQIVQASPQLGVKFIDSCSTAGSFIEHVWPDRCSIASHMFMTTRIGVLGGALVGGLRWVRHRAGQLLEKTGSSQ